MVIGLFTDTYLPDVNGVVSAVEILRKKLIEKGHEVYVICPYPGFLKIKKDGYIIRLPGIELKSLYGYKATSPAHFLFLEELEKYHFDLIHAHTEFGIGIFAGIAAKHLQVPLIRTYHTTYEDYTHYLNFMHMDTIEKMLKKMVSFLSRKYGESCMHLIAPSQKTADMLINYGIKTPISVIPTGIDLTHFARSINASDYQNIRRECQVALNQKMLLYVGRLAKEKSIDILLKAISKLPTNINNYKLVIIGSGPSEKDLHNLSSELDLNDKVVFLGKKEFSSIPLYYHSADAFLSASTSETQGLTYIEALASGLPVFARNDDALNDLIKEKENGYYFANEDELANKLLTFFAINKDEYLSLQNKAIIKAKEYDSEVFITNILALYNEVIDAYNSSYKIIEVKVKNDYVNISLCNDFGEKEELLVSVDDFYEEGLRKNEKINQKTLLKLRKLEDYTKAYRSCIKKIAGRDYTIKQMYDYLTNKFSLPISDINKIIDKLVERSLLNDYKYALNKLASWQASLYSQKKMINKLRDDGVAIEIINKCLNQSESSESQKAYKLAFKYQQTIRNKSVLVTKNSIIQKLLRSGFTYDVVKEAVSLLDFSKEEMLEQDVLRLEAEKVCKRLQKKYQGTLLRNHLFVALAAKGFRSEAIFALINEMELNDEKNY